MDCLFRRCCIRRLRDCGSEWMSGNIDPLSVIGMVWSGGHDKGVACADGAGGNCIGITVTGALMEPWLRLLPDHHCYPVIYMVVHSLADHCHYVHYDHYYYDYHNLMVVDSMIDDYWSDYCYRCRWCGASIAVWSHVDGNLSIS